MKKLLSFITILIFAVILIACDSRPKLKVFMPTEYIGEEFLKAFHENSEYRVDIITFDSNEDMLSKYASGSYDLIIPSDYALEELAAKDQLQEIDWERITTFNKSDIDSELTKAINSLNEGEEGYDLLKYGVPYFWGTFGILYDETKISTDLIAEEGWNILQSGRDLMIYDSSRDAVMVALKQIYANTNNTTSSVNNPTDADLALAEEWLKETKGSKTLVGTDEIFDLMMAPTQVDLALAYSGDAVYLMDENPDLNYYIPTSGSNIFIDAIVIPVGAEKVDLAYNFINYLLAEDNAYENSVESAYTSPRADVITTIIEDEVYPASSYRITYNEGLSTFRYNSDLSTKIINIWQRVLAA